MRLYSKGDERRSRVFVDADEEEEEGMSGARILPRVPDCLILAQASIKCELLKACLVMILYTCYSSI